jgi:dUTP pyrophosphatase
MNNIPYLKIKKLDNRAIIPSKKGEDGGFDFYGIIDEDDFVILKPLEIKKFRTGLACEIPKDWVLIFFERGSTGTKGISKRCGVIDSGYRGEIFITINNTSDKFIVFTNKDKKLDEDFFRKNNLNKENTITYSLKKAIIQGILLYSPHIEVEVVEKLSDSERDTGKLGSSSK